MSKSSDEWTVTQIVRGPGRLERDHPLTIREGFEQMNVDEVKQERLKLAADIEVLINSFQERTGVTVKTVDLSRFLTVTADIPVKTEVRIKLEI